MDVPTTADRPASSAIEDSNDGLRRYTPKSHHLDKRANAILATEPADKGHGPDDVLVTKEVARWLGVSVSWLHNARCKKIGPPASDLSGRQMIRYRRGDVTEWLRSRCRAQSSA